MSMADRQLRRFGHFEFDPQTGELRKQGMRIRLEGQPIAILRMFLERPGQLLSREELQKRLWPAETFVDFEQSLNAAVKRLRGALGDSADAPRYVETLARRGYRFIASVEAVPVAPPSLGSTESPASGPVQAPGATAKSVRWLPWAALALLVVTAVLARRVFLVRRSPPSGRFMLVVLPFRNLSGDPRQEYFADGMTEEMITQLGSLDPRHLGVIARTSAMKYAGSRVDGTRIARELGVDYVLEGSITRTTDQVRVTAQLIQASDQTNLWADEYDRPVSDILRLQSDVARAIAARIRLTLSGPVRARLAGAGPLNVEAHEAYLLGLEAWNLRTKESTERAVSEFDHAVAIDPGYARGYAALARVYALAPVSGFLTSSEAMPKARDAALRALALDDSLAEGHSILAFVRAHFDYDWPAAEREFLRALELNPSDAYAHLFYSHSYLSPLGRHDAAIAEMQRALALDPLSAPVQSFLGRTYLWARRYEDALAQFRKCNQLFPAFALNHERLAHLLTYTGDFDGAIDEDSKARILAGEAPKDVASIEGEIRKALVARGPRGYWQALLDFSQSEKRPPEAYGDDYGLAILHSRLGERDKAIESLERAYSQRELALTEIAIEPAFDDLRTSPRFQSLLRRVGLAP
jgi:TolB-like protein/DNA-binding winged helix-turn-helix (wHTH) protein